MKRSFVTQDGNRIVYDVPEVIERAELCDCHRWMGNDFYFMPAGECLRPNRICNGPVQK